MATRIVERMATLHAGPDIVAGTLRILSGDRAVFVCARSPDAGVGCELAVAIPGSRSVRASVIVGRRTSAEGGRSEVDLIFQAGSKIDLATLVTLLLRAQAPARRVLLIDDSELLNKITASILEGAGYHVTCTTSPFETYRRIQDAEPDLVLVDYNIPALRGDDLIQMTRRAGLPIPMVLYSSAPEPVLREGMVRSGALTYIRKGTPKEELLEQLDMIFRRIGWQPKSSRGSADGPTKGDGSPKSSKSSPKS